MAVGRRFPLIVLAFAAAVALLVSLAVRHASPSRGIARLSRALGALPHGGRLAAVQAGAPEEPASRRIENWPADALGLVAAVPATSPSRDAVRLRAAIDLYRGAAAPAVAALEGALRTWPRDPFVLNDLSAAHLARAHELPDSAAVHLARAIERATEAAELRPGWPQPAHNRRAALEALGISGAAARIPSRALVPEDVIASDAATCAALTTRRAQAVRDLMELVLLPAWAERQIANDPSAGRYLETLDCLAGGRASVLGDRLFVQTVAAIRRAGVQDRRSLAGAHADYARGRTLYDSGQREGALQAFARARGALSRAGSAFEHEAALQHTIVVYQLRQLDEALDAAVRLRSLAVERGYPTVTARSSWVLGLVRMQRGRIEEAIEAHDAARLAYERLLEPENAASVANSAADTLRTAGDLIRGWMLLTHAARRYQEISSPQRQYLVLFNLSLFAQDEGLWRAAEEFQGAAVAAADRRGQSLTMIESRLRRAQLRLRRSEDAGARADLAAAGGLFGRVNSTASLAYLEAWRDRLRVQLDDRRHPAAASRAFEALIPRFEITEPAEIPSLCLEAGQAARASGDGLRARDLLRRGIAFATTRRDLLRAPEYRIAHFSTMWDLHHELVDLELERDQRAALEAADAGRAWLAARGGGGGGAQGVPPGFDLMPDEAVFYYAALRDRLVMWVLTGKGLRTRSVPYPAASLAADVIAFRQGIEPSARHGSPVGTLLFERVLAPALAAAPDARRIFVSPDGPLGDLPFVLLTDPATGRFVLEGHEIAYIPDLASLRRSTLQRASSVLSIGFNGTPGDGGPSLRMAEIEAVAIAQAYPARRILAGAEASPGAVAASLEGRDVIHIAAHAEAHRLAPWQSFVRLAPEGGAHEPGVLRFGEAADWDLRGCALVVLSACETAGGSRIRAFGTVNMAGPFLSAGAGAVAGTLWRIDDRASAAFMPLFHRRVAGGMPPAAALRAAQLEALRSGNPDLSAPSAWGAWVLYARAVPPG